ncbi:MAG: hypothetical protein WKF86_07755 [Acidimicrobiales bacterium]
MRRRLQRWHPDLRSAVADKLQARNAEYRSRLGAPPGVDGQAAGLRAGGTVVLVGWDLDDLVGGLDLHARYRLEVDGSLTEVHRVPGAEPFRGTWEPVRAADRTPPPTPTGPSRPTNRRLGRQKRAPQ